MTDAVTVPRAVSDYFDAINREDWKFLSTLWHDDPELVPVGSPPRRGRDDVMAFYRKALAPWPSHLDTPTRTTVAGNTVVVEITFAGTTPDGRRIEFDAVDIIDLGEDGRIRRLSNWYDVGTVRELVTGVASAVHEYFRSVNAEDWDALRRLWHEHGELVAVGARPRRGRDDVMSYYRRIFAGWTSHHDAATRVLTSGHTATVEVHFTGRTAAGRDVEFDAIDVIDVEAGLIRRLTNWYDLAWVRGAMADR